MMVVQGITIDNRYQQLDAAFYTPMQPSPLRNPRLLAVNRSLAAQLGLSLPSDPDLCALGAGKMLYEGMAPLAMKYSGHQFGQYNPDLGDGRGLLLWQHRDAQGQLWDWHLKGAGRTPYSRHGDGRAVLRSTLREYLCGEAMHGLGIATSRALLMVGSDERVVREQMETAATLIRIARTHLRFGHFEFAFYQGHADLLRQLADHAIDTCYPALLGLDAPERYQRLLDEMIQRTARLIAQWQAVGFVHAVMNTDNMSVLGETFDYGPYSFLDAFDARLISNQNDQAGRYAFYRQPDVGYWNCQALARTFVHLLTADQIKLALSQYAPVYNAAFLQLMRSKLGLLAPQTDAAGDQDLKLLSRLFHLLQQDGVDYTRFFRCLSQMDLPQAANPRDMFIQREAFDQWLALYQSRLAEDGRPDAERRSDMLASNPHYILRNYMAQNAIVAAEKGDMDELHQLVRLLQNPFEEQPGFEQYAALPPDWSKRIWLTCSS